MAPNSSFGHKKRKRGAQPGNLNALKHGFYSAQFQDDEILDLDAHMDQGLDQEIAMLRVATRRLLQLSEGIEDINTTIHIVGSLGLSAIRLAGLLRARKLLGGDKSDETLAIINQAIGEVVKEMRLKI